VSFKEKNSRDKQDKFKEQSDIEERVVTINRCSKVVKGGRNFSFSALVVVGDKKGNVGIGLGKANEVADSIKKGASLAKNSMFKVPMRGHTLPHEIQAKHRGGKVIIRPASEGTGIIAGSGMRAVLELAGYRDVLAKSLGSNTPINVVKATVCALHELRSYKDTMLKRELKTF